MTEIVEQRLAIHPVTGEALELSTATTDVLAEAIEACDTVAGRARDTKRELGNEVLARMDAEAKWTARVGGYKLTGASPAPKVEYDAAALAAALDDLVQKGVIAEGARESAIEVVVTFKPRQAGINALKKLGPEVADAIAACEQTVEKARSVRVTREVSA